MMEGYFKKSRWVPDRGHASSSVLDCAWATERSYRQRSPTTPSALESQRALKKTVAPFSLSGPSFLSQRGLQSKLKTQDAIEDVA